MQRPLVSIVTPSFNQVAFLGHTLRSVASQTYQPIEHIVMDGGSTDGSVELIERFSRTHPLEWHSEPDHGQAEAIQRGIHLASGEVVGWLNSDDVYLDEMVISDVIEEFERGADVVTGGGWHLTRSGFPFHHIPVRSDRLSYSRLRCGAWVLQPATFFKRSLFIAHGLDTSLHYAFDWDFFIRVSRQARITPMNRDIAGYRIHRTGKSVTGGTRRYQELLEVVGRHNGRHSPRYRLLATVAAMHQATGLLPAPLNTVAFLGLYAFARFTNSSTGGRGIPY